MYIRRSEGLLDVFWTSYVSSIYVLCLRGNTYKNVDGNSKFNITKSSPWKSTFWKPPVIAKDEIKVGVIPVNKYVKNGQSQEFHHLDLFLRLLAYCNTSTISISILVFFFFEDFFKTSKEQKAINEI